MKKWQSRKVKYCIISFIKHPQLDKGEMEKREELMGAWEGEGGLIINGSTISCFVVLGSSVS